MEILDAFLRRVDSPELLNMYDASIKVITRKVKEIADQQNPESFLVVVSGKGEIFSLGTSRHIPEIAEKEGIDLPQKLIDALNSPLLLGGQLKDVYAGGLAGEIRRPFMEDIIGEENTARLLDRSNQLVLYVDDHIGTGTKASLLINGLQPLLNQQKSRIVFISPVTGNANMKNNPNVIVGSDDPGLFNYLQKATLNWTT